MNYRILQDGLAVAWSFSRNEAMHYAMVYSTDGPLELQERKGDRWKTIMWINEGVDDDE